MNTVIKLASALALGLGLAACQTTTDGRSTTAAGVEPADVSPQEAALAKRIGQFNTAIRKNDYDTVIGIMPPKVLAQFSKQMGMPVAEVKKQLAAASKSVMSAATVHSAQMFMPSDGIRQSRGLSYALLPTSTDMTIGGKRLKQDTTTVAILDGGAWYLVRVDDAQADALVKAAYPALKGVKLF